MPADKPEVDGNAIARCLRYYFHEFCQQYKVDDGNRRFVHVFAFRNWLKQRLTGDEPVGGIPRELQRGNDGTALDEIMEESNTTLPVAEKLVELLADTQDNLNFFTAIWPFVSLGDVENMHAIKTAVLQLLIRYRDGTVAVVSRAADADVSGMMIRDADLQVICRGQPPELAMQLLKFGADGLHDIALRGGCFTAGDTLTDLVRHAGTYTGGNLEEVVGAANFLKTMFESFAAPKPEPRPGVLVDEG